MKTRPRAGAQPKVYASSVVQEGAELGLDTVVGAFCFVARGARIGAGTRVQSHTSVWDGVELGQDVFVGPAATFTNVRRPRAKWPRKPRSAGSSEARARTDAPKDWDRTIVEDEASIGAAAVLVAPVRVGARAMIGAGAVVTRDVPSNAIVAGNPASVIGFACACGERLSRGAHPPKRVTCKHCGARWEADGLGLRSCR